MTTQLEAEQEVLDEQIPEILEADEEVADEEEGEEVVDEEPDLEPDVDLGPSEAELAAERATTLARAETRLQASLVGKPDEQAELDDKKSVIEWLAAFGSHGEIIVTLKRTWPKVWDGIQCGGTLPGSYDMALSEEQIQQEHGGGKFQITVYRKNAKGRRGYLNARTFEIAGEPRLDRLRLKGSANGSPENPTIVAQAMTLMHQTAESERRAASDARANNSNQGMDIAAMQALNAPLLTQINSLTEQNAALQRQAFEAASKPVDNSSQDKLFDIMSNKETSHGNDIQAIRANHDSEIRQMREFERDEIKRREARFEKELDHVREAATREVATLTLAHGQAMKSQELGYAMRIDSLQETQKRTDRELGESRIEVVALREKKELSPLQQMQGVVDLKNAFEALTPEAEPKGWMEKAAEGAAPLIEAAAMRLAGAGPAEQAQLEAAEEDPLVKVRFADGKETHMPRSQAQRLVAQAEAQQQQQKEEHQEEVKKGTAIDIDEASIKLAATFMQSAFENGTDPEVFANSARSAIPAPILDHLKRHGADAFLENVCKIDASSRLQSVEGRNFIRKVANYLLRGATEDPSSP